MLLSPLLALLLLAPPAPPAPPKPAAPVYHVPYRLTGTKHLLVRAKLNGHGPYNFIIDTGAPSLFVGSDLAKQLGLKADKDGWAPVDRLEVEGGAVLRGVRGRVDDPF